MNFVNSTAFTVVAISSTAKSLADVDIRWRWRLRSQVRVTDYGVCFITAEMFLTTSEL